MRADISAPDSRYLVPVTGADRGAALQAAEKIGAHLDRLVTARCHRRLRQPGPFPAQSGHAGRTAGQPANA
ncbi:MAG: hypothetical protein IPL58_12905 [Betaproteobacteria bacterium]|uniref:Uncharacterized protein n=1 Tax=Candidatus Proximibacter danicus TaxID=2954365 RepID=A0A9D7K262_9PROT|nr:hypothetical protein [Candidatus Proximibacter danicus]